MSNELIKYNLCACKCVWNLEYCFCFLHVYYMHRDVKSAKEKKVMRSVSWRNKIDPVTSSASRKSHKVVLSVFYFSALHFLLLGLKRALWFWWNFLSLKSNDGEEKKKEKCVTMWEFMWRLKFSIFKRRYRLFQAEIGVQGWSEIPSAESSFAIKFVFAAQSRESHENLQPSIYTLISSS